MKHEIMAKLFDNKELTSEEMIYIGKNLPETDTMSKIPFDHTKQDIDSCGITKDDFEHVNNYLKLHVEDKKKDFKAFSEYIEKFEEIVLSDPKNMRVILINYVKMMLTSQNPLLGMLMALRGGRPDPSDLE